MGKVIGRAVKDNLSYFTHDNDARNHPKMKALRARYGWTGYGQFWALNEMIAAADKAMLDLSRKVVRASVACELGMTPDALDDLLAFLANPDECGLVHYDDGILMTDRTQEDFGRVDTRREQKRERQRQYAEKLKRPTSGAPVDGQNQEMDGHFTNMEGQNAPDKIRDRLEIDKSRDREDKSNTYTPSSPEPVTAAPSAVAVVKPDTDPLYQALWQSFIAKTPVMANYAAQGKATHRLVAFVRKHADKDDPESALELARQLVTKYFQLTQGPDKFWRSQPFTPMNLSAAGILDRVIQELQAEQAQPEVDLDSIPF